MEEANLEFLRNNMQWDLEKREVDFIEYDESKFKTTKHRLDGVDPLIMYGTGSSSCTITVWFPYGA
jgi:hypothetical protein